MTTTNKTVLDLNKVQHATFWWENEYGHRRVKKPDYTFLNNTVPSALVNDANKHKLDCWHELVELQLTANHSIIYRGKKAVSLWKAWCEKIFKKG